MWLQKNGISGSCPFKSCFLLSWFTVLLSGCLGNTLVSEDSQTFIGTVEVKKELSPKASAQFSLNATVGDEVQVYSSSVPLDGISFDEPVNIKNKYFFQTLTGHYQYDFINHDRFRVGLAPGIQLANYSLDSTSEAFNKDSDKMFATFGLKLDTALNITEQHALAVHLGTYFRPSSGLGVVDYGISLVFKHNNGYHLKAGYRLLSLDDEKRESSVSPDVSLISSGVHMGIEFLR